MKVAMMLAMVGAAAVAQPLQPEDLTREEYVEYLNNVPGMTWTAKVDERFAPYPNGEHIRTLAGVKGDHMESVSAAIADGTVTEVHEVAADIPDEFDSATNFKECADVISDIRDQSACGCCWAFGAAEAASDRMCIASKGEMKMPLSAQDVCFCGSLDGCGGGQLAAAWLHIKLGVVTGGQYNNTGPFKDYCSAFSLPHCHHHGPTGNDPYPDEGTPGCPNAHSPQCPRKCDANADDDHNKWTHDKITFTGLVATFSGESKIQTALMAGGPVEAAFDVYSDFENYASGVYQHTSGSYMGGHAIKIVGWGVDNDVKYWKVQNSWNPYWGENGYFRIKRGDNECGIESGTMAAHNDAKWHYKEQH